MRRVRAPAEASLSCRVDLHCHTSASFDSRADPKDVVSRAVARGLTHLAITDHETVDGAYRALEAADAAEPGLTVLIGSEVHTREGDLIFVFLSTALPEGLSAAEAIQAGREQGAMIGIPHPFDSTRRSLLLDPENAPLIGLVDWVEGCNGRVAHQTANDRAIEVAGQAGVPSIGASDAHSLLEVASTYTLMTGDPSTPAGLCAALLGPMRITGGSSAAPSGR